MNHWFSFLLGAGMTGSLLIAVAFTLWSVATHTPEAALSSIAACLRGFARRLDSLHVVVLVGGERVLIAFSQIADAIEHAELAYHRCDEDGFRLRASGFSSEPGSSELKFSSVAEAYLDTLEHSASGSSPEPEARSPKPEAPRSDRDEDPAPATLPSPPARPS